MSSCMKQHVNRMLKKFASGVFASLSRSVKGEM